MTRPAVHLTLGAKVALLGACSVLVTALALVLLSVWQSGQYNALAQNEVNALIEADLDHITQGVYNLVRTENEAVQVQIKGNLDVARHLLRDAGGASLGKDLVEWTAINQLTRDAQQIELPRFLIGGQWLGKNQEVMRETPIVDMVNRLGGEAATLFQRMNDQGDMLRVATTIKATPHERAIGTYIPATGPDGVPNPVIAAILRGETYLGRAYVVSDWQLTAYEPIRDPQNRVIGMLNVGVSQQAVAARIRQAILQTSVGKSGYVYILAGSGQDRGQYIISYKGERDGENIWDNRDSDGNLVIQAIINKATGVEPGKMATIRYRWQNRGEIEPRWKIARLAYYEPWDWVIGTSVYEDELQTYSTLLSNGRARMIRIMVMAGGVITLLVGLVCLLLSWSITRPVRQMIEAAQQIIDGDYSHVVPMASHDEIGTLARTFNAMTQALQRSTEELRQSEEKYRGIFENALEGLFQSSIDGRFLSANPALAATLGYESPQDLIESVANRKEQFYVDPTDRNILISAIRNQGKASGFEVQFWRKDGSRIWISISATLRQDEAGKPRVIEGFISDIDKRKRAEEALAESRTYLNEIINSVGDPLFVKDSNHRLVLVNNAYCTLMDLRRDELLGRSDYDFFADEEVRVFWAKDDLVLFSGEEDINEEPLTDGSGIHHLLLTKRTLYQDKRGDKYIVGVIRDITEQKEAAEERLRLEARLNQAQKMEAIGTLAGGIAHDFNNILQPMLGYSELLLLRLPPDDPQRQFVERLHAAGLRAKELIGHILTFSRRTEHKIVPVQVQTILKEVVQLCRSTIPSNIDIRTEIESDCPSVLIDPSQLHQVAMNIIINAYHAVEATGGTISIHLSEIALDRDELHGSTLPPGRYALFVVSDSGCGIDPANLDRVFEPYFTTKEQGKGTGLGLSVVHGIVKKCGGDIRIDSELGRGTTIKIYLPLQDASGERQRPEAIKAYPGGDERVLVIDDEEMIIDITTLHLESLGYRVTSRANSVEALDLFATDPAAFDLVITDLTMPNLTGDQLARELIAIRPDLPIIVCSGFSERIGQDMARALGIKALLMKPVAFEELAHKVRAVLDARKGT